MAKEVKKDTSAHEFSVKRAELAGDIKKFLDISWADLNSFFLGIYEKKIDKILPADLLSNYLNNNFLKASDADPKKINEIEHLLFSLLPSEFKAVDISPVSPIGLNTVLAKISSKTSLSTIRNMEVLSDPTTQLALEAAKIKLANKDIGIINLATACRLLRTQKFDANSGMTNHFKAFALATSGKNIGDRTFEHNAMLNHIDIWLAFIQKSKTLGYKPQNITVALSNTSIMNELCNAEVVNKKNVIESIRYDRKSIFEKDSVQLIREIEDITQLTENPYEFLHAPLETLKRAESDFVGTLRKTHPDIKFYYRLDRIAGATFYSGLCFKIYAIAPDGTKQALVDGGVSDWNKKILQNNKELIFTSGFGSELYSKFFS